MNKEQQDRKEKTLEDKFNSISSQAEGWGQALTQVGVAWKMGNKVAKNARELAGKVKDAAGKIKDAAQGKTGTTEESTANVKPSGAGETATSEGDLVPLSKTPVRDAIQQKIRDNQTKASEDSTPSGGQSGAPAQPTSASDVPPSADGIKVPSQNKLGKILYIHKQILELLVMVLGVEADKRRLWLIMLELLPQPMLMLWELLPPLLFLIL